MGRSAGGSMYSAPKAPNAPQGAADYNFLSGIYGAAYGRKQGADFARPTNLVRKKPKLESIINPNQPKPDTSIGTGSGREGIFRPDVAGEETPPSDMLATQTDAEDVMSKEELQNELSRILGDIYGQNADDTTGDLATDDTAFEDYLESDDYVQTTAGGGSTTMDDAAADPFDETVTTMDDQTTLTGGAADTEDDGTVTTMDEEITLGEGVADTEEDVVTTMDEVPTMDEYLASIADQDARDRIKFEDLLEVQAKSGAGLLSIREYNNLIQNRITALDESTATVSFAQLQAEEAEIERLQGLTEQNALEEGYAAYVEQYNQLNAPALDLTLGEDVFTLGDPADNPVDPTFSYEDQINNERSTGLDLSDTVVADISKPALSQAEFGGTFEEYQDYIGDYQSKLMDSTLSGAEMNELLANATIIGRGQYADDFYFNNPNSTDEGLTRDRDEVTVISDPPKPTDEVVTTPEGTESTVPDEPESVVLSPEEQWYTENYPELQKQITDQYNGIKEFLEGRGLEEGTLEFNAMLEKNSTYQALIAQRSGLYFMEVLYNP